MKNDGAELSANTPFGIAARVVISRLLDRMYRHLPGTLAGEDIEELHDMRVASRRLRAALRIFKPCFKKKQFKPVESRVKAVTQALGLVRDQDVFLEYLSGYQASSGLHIDWVVEQEEQIREEARAGMIDSLTDLSRSSLRQEITALLDNAGMTTDSGNIGRANSFAAQAPALVEERLAEMREVSDAIEDPEKVEELHQMRIAAKRLRYTMEAFIPCFGKPLQEKIDAVKLLQEQLGSVHDCDVWIDKLENYRNGPDVTPERLDALEKVIEERHRQREESYKEARAHWRGLTGARFADSLMSLVSAEPLIEYETTLEEVDVMEKDKKQSEAIVDVESPEAVEQEAQPVEETAREPKPKTPKKRTKAQPEEPVAEKEPQPAMLTEVRQALDEAKSRLPQDENPSKLAKQLDKVSDTLDLVETANLRRDKKLEKRLLKLRDSLLETPENDKMADKDMEKLRQKLRTQRKKLSGMLEQ